MLPHTLLKIVKFKAYEEALMSLMYITNGFNDKRIEVGSTIPDGWKPGRMKSCVTTAGNKWCTDGVRNIMLKPDDVLPDGFWFGRTKSKDWIEKQSKSLQTKNYKHYTDGVTELFLSDEDEVPEGFALGRLPISETTRSLLSQSHIGLKHTEATRKKISEHSNNNRPKARKTCLEKYGVEHVWACPEIIAKSEATKRKNKTFNSSNPEKELKKKLIEQYGDRNVLTNYKSDVYPYRCDFYIICENKYIELNAHWTHGGKPFDEDDPWCQQQLSKWKKLAEKSKYYEAAIDTWTKRDVEKLACAKRNNLNYEMIY